MTIFQCAIKIVTDRSDFLKGIAWKNWVFFKSIYYLIYTKRWKIFLLTEFSIFYLKIPQKNRYSIHTVLRKRCSSNITLSSLVGPGLFNRQLKPSRILDGFSLYRNFLEILFKLLSCQMRPEGGQLMPDIGFQIIFVRAFSWIPDNWIENIGIKRRYSTISNFP